MANVTVSAALRAAMNRKDADEAALIARRWTFEVGDLADRVHGLRRTALAIDADELTGPLNSAYRELQQAFTVVFIAWRRLER